MKADTKQSLIIVVCGILIAVVLLTLIALHEEELAEKPIPVIAISAVPLETALERGGDWTHIPLANGAPSCYKMSYPLGSRNPKTPAAIGQCLLVLVRQERGNPMDFSNSIETAPDGTRYATLNWTVRP